MMFGRIQLNQRVRTLSADYSLTAFAAFGAEVSS